MAVLEIFANNHFVPPGSHAAVALLDLGYLAAAYFCLRELFGAQRAALDAEAAHDAKTPLREGARFVAGRVEHARGEPVAVRVTLWQQGSEQLGKHPQHTWSETARKVEARPFYVRHAGGERVRVEPGRASVLLVDALDQMQWTERTRRGLRAELTAGEPVVVEGALARGYDPEAAPGGATYREATPGWVLAPERARLYCSTEGLARRHLLRARAFRSVLFTLPWLWLLGQVPLVNYRARQLLGRSVQAEYLGRQFWETRGSKGGTQAHYAVTYRYEDPHLGAQYARDEVDRDDYHALPEALLGELGLGGASPLQVSDEAPERVSLWVTVVPGFPRLGSPGRGASVHVAWVLFSAASLGWALWLVRRCHAHKRWYEAPRVDRAPGPLPSPPGTRFAE